MALVLDHAEGEGHCGEVGRDLVEDVFGGFHFKFVGLVDVAFEDGCAVWGEKRSDDVRSFVVMR